MLKREGGKQFNTDLKQRITQQGKGETQERKVDEKVPLW